MKRRHFLTLTAAGIAGLAVSPAFGVNTLRPALRLWGDGIHDDTKALQAWADGRPVILNEWAKPGLLSGGTYLVTDTIHLSSDTTIRNASFVCEPQRDVPTLSAQNVRNVALYNNTFFNSNTLPFNF